MRSSSHLVCPAIGRTPRAADSDSHGRASKVSMVYAVTGISCRNCVSSITTRLGRLAGVVGVDVDLAAKTVTVHGQPDDEAVRAGIEEAGYKVLTTAGP
jgi:copper chaperone